MEKMKLLCFVMSWHPPVLNCMTGFWAAVSVYQTSGASFRQDFSLANTALFCIAKDDVCHRSSGQCPGENILVVLQGCRGMGSEFTAATTLS